MSRAEDPKVPANAAFGRREFLGAGAAVVAGLASGCGPAEEESPGQRGAAVAVGEPWADRRAEAERIRKAQAAANRQNTPAHLTHQTNPDDEIYPDRIASYSKGLPHDRNGEVDRRAYAALLRALSQGHRDPALFERVPMGGGRRLVNPQAGLAFEMEGGDPHCFPCAPPPAFASREIAAEIAENYWMAVLRDVPFSRYRSDPVAAAAAADLSAFGGDFKGAKVGGRVTPAALFRGVFDGDLLGPYLSQFFYQACPFGAEQLDQRAAVTRPLADGGRDYMTRFDGGPGSWLDAQRGVDPPEGPIVDPVRRYLRSGRDLGHWVHIDVLFQAYFKAFLILDGLGAPVDEGNPYRGSATQAGFGTFGAPHVASLLCEVATRALHATWFQKWFVHRRLRPEVYAARAHRVLHDRACYPVHPEILASLASATRLGGHLPAGNALLPMAYPEGSPQHPAYTAGHATVAGACVTILKAWYKEDERLSGVLAGRGRQLLQPSEDGLALVPYEEADAGLMTVGGELNKLAANVAIGRNIAGVHWRSDATESMRLGEAVAIQLMKEHRATYNERFSGFRLTRFDGVRVVV